MKICLNCKTTNPDDANYCRHCGFPLESDKELILKKAISSFEGAYRQIAKELEEKNKKIVELQHICELYHINSYETKSDYSSCIEAVDLGLSVNWANCNLGAHSPEEAGLFYTWGETEPKKDYSWATCKYSDSSGKSFTKYNSTSGGIKDFKTRLDYGDDAARVALGEGWRMPGQNEIIEIKNNCKWQWSNWGNVYGYTIKSKKTGREIFLPAIGYYDGTAFHKNSSGYYLINTPCSDNSSSVLVLTLDANSHEINRYSRYYGFSIRPIRQK